MKDPSIITSRFSPNEINDLVEILGQDARFVANHYDFYDKIVILPSGEGHAVLSCDVLSGIVKNKQFTIESYENNSIAIFIRNHK